MGTEIQPPVKPAANIYGIMNYWLNHEGPLNGVYTAVMWDSKASERGVKLTDSVPAGLKLGNGKLTGVKVDNITHLFLEDADNILVLGSLGKTEGLNESANSKSAYGLIVDPDPDNMEMFNDMIKGARLYGKVILNSPDYRKNKGFAFTHNDNVNDFYSNLAAYADDTTSKNSESQAAIN